MPYQPRSVWIDVSGVLAVLALLLVPLGILASEVISGGVGTSGGSGGGVASGGAGPAPRAESGLRARRSAPPSRTPSIFGGGRSVGEASGVEAPFSDRWRSQATPDLTGPTGVGEAGSGGAWAGGSAFGGGAPDSDGPTIASRRSLGGTESPSARRRTRSGGASWRAEARNLSGRARALSNQLGQLERQGNAASESAARSSREKAPAKTSSGQGTASTNSDPGTPTDPDQVPIDDHLHWLLVAGLLWGMWRLHRGV